jgi:ribosome-associated toxin RatA of RatAB toxin-antitoxin module
MAIISHKVLVPYTKEQMFNLVNDVASYTEFLPGCTYSKVLSETDSSLKARVELQKGPVNVYWISENTNIYADSITMRYIEGTFSHMSGKWLFSSSIENSCEVSFSLDYDFSSRLVRMAISPVLNAMIITIVNCFKSRAKEVYSNV